MISSDWLFVILLVHVGSMARQRPEEQALMKMKKESTVSYGESTNSVFVYNEFKL